MRGLYVRHLEKFSITSKPLVRIGRPFLGKWSESYSRGKESIN